MRELNGLECLQNDLIIVYKILPNVHVHTLVCHSLTTLGAIPIPLGFLTGIFY